MLSSLSLLPQAVVTGILMGLIYGLVAAGLAIIWGVVDIVNFAHGEYMLIAMFTTVLVSNTFGVDPLLMLPVNVVLLFVIGYLSYTVVISRVINGPIFAQVLATFALLLILRYGMLAAFGSQTRTLDSFVFDGRVELLGVAVSLPQLVAAVFCVAGVGVLYYVLKHTKTGRAIRATAQDREAARVLGINDDRIFALTWGIGIAAVAVAGTLAATFYPTQAETTPEIWTIIAFAAVALGGLGGVLAAVAGGLIIGLVENMSVTLISSQYRSFYIFAVLLIGLIYSREGILNWVSTHE